MRDPLELADYVALLAYLGGTLWLGFRIGRRVTTGKDFFLAGRSLPWWAVGMSLVATDIGGTDVIGVGGAAYRHGLAVANFEWIGCIPAMIVGAFVFIPHFWRSGVATIPEFLERRFGVGVRSAVALCWLAFMACNLGIMLFASAKMAHASLGLDFRDASLGPIALAGHELSVAIIAVALITGAYTMAGGLAAVVYTDVLQCAVMIGGCLLVLVFGLAEVGGIGALGERIAERAAGSGAAVPSLVEQTELILPVDTATPFPWTGILFGLALILSPAYWIGNQAIVQRALGARSEFEAKASYVWGAVLKNVIPLIVAVPGLVALVLLPDVGDADQAIPLLANRLLPPGVRGMFLAAFLAALMSSVDSYLNSASTIFVNDLYLRFTGKSMEGRGTVWVGRATTGGLMVWAIGFAIACTRLQDSGIYGVFQTLMSFFQGPALAVLLGGLFWARANRHGAFWGFVIGVGSAVALFTANQPAVRSALGWRPLFQIAEPFLYFSIWSFVITALVLVLVSAATPAESADRIAPLLYHRRRPRA